MPEEEKGKWMEIDKEEFGAAGWIGEYKRMGLEEERWKVCEDARWRVLWGLDEQELHVVLWEEKDLDFEIKFVILLMDMMAFHFGYSFKKLFNLSNGIFLIN